MNGGNSCHSAGLLPTPPRIAGLLPDDTYALKGSRPKSYQIG